MQTATSWFFVLVLCATLCGCGRRAEDIPAKTVAFPAAGAPATPETIPPRPEVRTEFVILRELVKQHAKQTEAGNGDLLESVRRHLRERVESVPDTGRNDEERKILKEAKALVEGNKTK